MRKLIVDADDFGLTRGINQGILETIEKGIVQSINVISNMPYYEEVLNLVKKYPHVSVGIHFNLVTGKPISSLEKVRSLVDEKGNFLTGANFKKKYLKGKIKKKEISHELEEQIKALTNLGIKPTHFNFHQIKLLFPRILPLIIRITKKYKINKMRSYNRFLITEKPNFIYYFSRPTKIFTNFYLKFLTFYLNKFGIKTADRIIDFGIDFKNEATLDNWFFVIRNLPQGINEIRVHPGYVDEELPQFSSYLKGREREIQILTNPELKELIKKNQIELISFKEF